MQRMCAIAAGIKLDWKHAESVWITCGGVPFQTEAAFNFWQQWLDAFVSFQNDIVSKMLHLRYCFQNATPHLRYCFQNFPIKATAASTGCWGQESFPIDQYQYVIFFLQTNHDQIWQQKLYFSLGQSYTLHQTKLVTQCVTHINCVGGGFEHNTASLVMILMSWLSDWLIVNILRQ